VTGAADDDTLQFYRRNAGPTMLHIVVGKSAS
jgi:hypothetical protein